MNDTIRLLLKNLVLLLVKSEFSEVVARNENGRLSQAEIEGALNDYPGIITLPPDSAFETACVYEVYDRNSEARKVELDLWYDGTVSDLTLSVDIQKNESGDFVISIDDIHVL